MQEGGEYRETLTGGIWLLFNKRICALNTLRFSHKSYFKNIEIITFKNPTNWFNHNKSWNPGARWHTTETIYVKVSHFHEGICEELT